MSIATLLAFITEAAATASGDGGRGYLARHGPPAQQGRDRGQWQCDHEHRCVAGLHHRRCRHGERRGRHQGTDGQQGERKAQRPARRLLARGLQQGEAARGRGAESCQRADKGGCPGAERLAQHQRLHERARHHQQARLFERRREAQPERLADRLEGHVGGDAIDHDRRHDGEKGGQVQALDEQDDRHDGDRHEEGGEEHDGATLEQISSTSMITLIEPRAWRSAVQ